MLRNSHVRARPTFPWNIRVELKIDETDTVGDERLAGADGAVIAYRSRAEDRALVTLDLDFSNVLAYPPAEYAGIVLRLKRQDKPAVLTLMHGVVLTLTSRTPLG